MLDSMAIAIVFAVFMIVALMGGVVLMLWRRQAARAIANGAILATVAGLLSMLVYQNEWVQYRFGGVIGWGGLSEWVYQLPFGISGVLLLTLGVLTGVRFVRTRLALMRDRAALAQAERTVMLGVPHAH